MFDFSPMCVFECLLKCLAIIILISICLAGTRTFAAGCQRPQPPRPSSTRPPPSWQRYPPPYSRWWWGWGSGSGSTELGSGWESGSGLIAIHRAGSADVVAGTVPMTQGGSMDHITYAITISSQKDYCKAFNNIEWSSYHLNFQHLNADSLHEYLRPRRRCYNAGISYLFSDTSSLRYCSPSNATVS